MKSTCCKRPLLTFHVKVESFPGRVFVTRLKNAPTLKVLLDLLQLCLAFHSKVYKHNTTSNRNTLSPGLTGFRHRSPCLKGQRSPPSVRTTVDRQHLQGTQRSRWIPKWLLTGRFSTSAINPHPSTLQTQVLKTQMSDSHRWSQVHISCMPTWHTSFQISTPWHAGPSMIWCWGSQPTHRRKHTQALASSVSHRTSVLKAPLHAVKQAEALFHNLFIQKSTYSAPSTQGQGPGMLEVNTPFQHPKQAPTQGLTPCSPLYTVPCLSLSAFLHVVGKVLCLPAFWRFLQKAWLNVSTNANFGWGPTIQKISNADLA